MENIINNNALNEPNQKIGNQHFVTDTDIGDKVLFNAEKGGDVD